MARTEIEFGEFMGMNKDRSHYPPCSIVIPILCETQYLTVIINPKTGNPSIPETEGLFP
jgi:hypothetical protein